MLSLQSTLFPIIIGGQYSTKSGGKGKHIDEKDRRDLFSRPRMRRCGLFTIFLCCAAALFSDAGNGIFSKVANDLGKIGPRMENSDQERAYFAYIESFASSLGLSVRFSDFSHSKDAHSFSKVATVHLEGQRSDVLVVAVSADSRQGYSGDVPSALALAMMEGLSREKENAMPICVDFVFIGAEYPIPGSRSAASYPLGSHRVISDYLESKSASVLYLGMDALSERVQVDHYAPGKVSPYWIFKKASDALGRTGFGISHKGSLSLFYRASLLDDTCAASAFLASDIPALELGRAGDPSDSGRSEEIAQRWIAFLKAFIDENAQGFPDDWDKHYFILDGPRGPLVLTEPAFVLAILGVILIACLVFMLSSIFARGNVIGLVSGFSRSFLSLPLCFLTCLGALYLSSLLMSALFMLKGTQEYWRAAPLPYMVCHSLIAFSAFAIACVLLMKARLMPLTISFYGAGAALLFFTAIFVYSSVDVSFSVFFAWASIACLAAMLFRNRPIGVLSYLFILAPFVILLSSGGFRDAGTLQRLLIAPGLRQSALLAILILPLLLFLIRLILLFYRHEGLPGRGFILGTGIACACIIVSAAAFCLAYRPYSKGNPTPVSIIEEDDGPGSPIRLRVDSTSRISGQWIEGPRGAIGLSGRTPVSLSLPDSAHDNFGLTVDRTSFLNRKRILVGFEAKQAPGEIRCVVESPSALSIYDCSYPYSLSGDGKTARIFIGANPRLPLYLELTVSKDFEARLGVEVSSFDPSGLRLSPGLRLGSYERIDRRSVVLR